jgi:succinate dehydrogenase/fumarate reductase flavoprotein subunit
MTQELLETDVLVIGGAGAGARAAIEAQDHGAAVAMLSKGPVGRSGTTPQAWPSFEAAFGAADPRDTPQVHFEDTVREGRLLGDENLVWAMASEAPDRVVDLESYGVRFEKEDGRFVQVHHPGQTYPRCLIIKGGGYGLGAGLRREVRRRSEIDVLPDVMVTRLLLGDGRVVGATGLNLRDGSFVEVRAKATVLATGGYEQLWETTDTAHDTTGDGLALAYRAGAELVDMEMVLYYPTVIVHPQELAGTLVQYEGLLRPTYVAGKLLNAEGEEFLPPGPLPVRDVLMRLMFDEIKEGRGTDHGGLYIDITSSPKSSDEIDALLRKLRSLPFNNLKDLGIDVKTSRIEVAPGLHFSLGGVHITERGETTVPGLYAAGEITGNVHGANRLSGNALAETQVFGARAGRFAAREAASLSQLARAHPDEVEAEAQKIEALFSRKRDGVRPLELKAEVKALMERYVGVPRDRDGLNRALAELHRLEREVLPRIHAIGPRAFNNEYREALEVSLMLDTAKAVVVSALLREESRGHHQRSDYPEARGEWLKHTAVRQGDEGPESYAVPVVRLESFAD